MPSNKRNTGSQETVGPARKRPFVCTVLLTAALTYFITLAMLFSAALIYSGIITDTLQKYLDTQGSTRFTWFAIGGSVLFLVASAGLLLMLLRYKGGFFLFFAATLVLFTLDLAFLEFDWLRYLIHSGFIFIAGILHFSKRCY